VLVYREIANGPDPKAPAAELATDN